MSDKSNKEGVTVGVGSGGSGFVGVKLGNLCPEFLVPGVRGRWCALGLGVGNQGRVASAIHGFAASSNPLSIRYTYILLIINNMA